MTRKAIFLTFGAGALCAGLFVAVGVAQASLVAQDRLHHQPGWLAIQLTWAVVIPAGVALLWLGHRLVARGTAVVARAGALAGLLGGTGCVLANVLIQMAWRTHRLESYPGVMPAFVPASIVAVLAAGALLGAALSVAGMAVGARRARMVPAAVA